MYRARISSLLGKITVVFVICYFGTGGLCVNTALALPGSGTQQDPWRIESLVDFDEFSADYNYWEGYTRLETDVNLAGRTYTTAVIARGIYYIGFTGAFDGNGHKIKNLTIDGGAYNDGLGLFGHLGIDGEVSNLVIEDSNIIGKDDYVGGIVGLNKGNVSNCYSTGSVSGDDHVGGLVGFNNGIVSNCYSIGDVRGDYDIGGLVGKNTGASVLNCYFSGTVSGDERVGGLVGDNYGNGSVSNCYSIGDVSGRTKVGGLVGKNFGSFLNCYSTGDVTGLGNVGGLVGINYYGSVSNCYSTGDVNGVGNVGGLVGENSDIISNSFWDTDTQTHGVTESIGRKNGIATNVAGLPTALMQTKSTFTDVGWDFISERHNGTTETWQIPDVGGYPVLSFFHIDIPVNLDGNGTVNEPYLVNDVNEMGIVSWYPDDCHFRLTEDIDLSGIHWSVAVVPVFTGCFDGDGHRVLNMQISGSGYLGLFGYLRNQGQIRNLCLDGGSVSGSGDCVGELVGYNWDGSISNCCSTGSVNGNSRIGGLVGINTGGISNCYSTGFVSGTDLYVGGLVGINLDSVMNCHSTAYVSGDWYVGGLVGDNLYRYVGGNWLRATVSNCYSSGDVSGDYSVGGLVGENNGTISDCYSTGYVNSVSYVGGLVGNSWGSISNCYSTGDVNGVSYVGGLVAYNVSSVSNCYSISFVSGDEGVGGLVGDNHYKASISNCFWDTDTSGQTTSDGGVGKTTAEMQTAATFFAWACEYVWTIDEGNDYPRLAWENMPGETITPRLYLYGNGTQAEPYLIYTADQFNMIGLLQCIWDKHFKLMADIDLSELTGTSFNIIGERYYDSGWIENPFTGVFDGDGHTISNFTYISTGKNYIGLFGYVGDPNAEIKDLGLINPNVDAGTGDRVGSLVGRLDNGTITNCYVEAGRVLGDYFFGGLVGVNFGTITNCYSKGIVDGYEAAGGLVGGNGGIIANSYSTGNVMGNRDVGGLVGYNSGKVSNSYSISSVTGTRYFVGGLVGENDGTITNCYSSSDVLGYGRVGGLVGYNSGRITNSFATSSVEGDEDVGGLVGNNNRGKVNNCYSTGFVMGSINIGGLLGENYKGTVSDSFWDIETSGQTISDGGTGLPTAEMQTMSTFTDAGWDFVGETFNGIEDIWFIVQQDYPRLWWQGMQVPMKLTPRTLNCRSEGNWVKAHITLPQGFAVTDVDSNKPAVLHSLGIESTPLYVFVNKDKLVEIEAAFERQAVCSLAGDWPDELTVAGFLADGNIFLGTSTVRIIHPGMKVIEELAWYWLNADCVHPDFCDGIDMNGDSLVNLLDYALLMNINVEFVTDE